MGSETTGPQTSRPEDKAQRAIPNQVMLQASYGARRRRSVYATALVAGRFFNETERYPARNLLDLGIEPTFRLSRHLHLPIQCTSTLGEISGFEVGAGLSLRL